MNKFLKNILQISLIAGITSSLFFNTIYHPKSILIWGMITLIIGIKTLIDDATPSKIQKITLVFLLISWISYFFSSTKNLGLNELTIQSILLLLLIFISQNNNLTAQKLKYFFNFIVLSSTFQAILAIHQFFYRSEIRSAGSFLSLYNPVEYFPNALGLYFLLSIPILFKIKSQKILAVLLTTNILGLFLSFSRGALLVFIIQILILAIYFLFKRKNKKLLTLITSVVISFIIFNLVNNLQTNSQPKVDLQAKYTFQGTEQITSLNERAQFFKGSLQIIKQNPLLGTGPNSFSYVYPSIQPLFLANAPHSHNLFLKIGSERGIFALATFILLIVWITKILINNQFIFKKQINVYLVVAITGAILHNIIDYNLNFSSNLSLIIIFTGILIAHTNKNKKILPNSKFNKNITLGLIFLTILITSFYTYKELSYKIGTRFISINPKIATKILNNLDYQNSNYILLDLMTSDQEKINTLLRQIKLNPNDSIAYMKLAELSQSRTEKKQNYQLALSKDPKNNWIHYNNFYNLNSLQEIQADEQKILTELSQYLDLAKQNIHYTAQHDNILQAQKLAQLFYNATNNNQFNSIAIDLKIAQEIFSS